jgi:putative ABC transport system permease protein
LKPIDLFQETVFGLSSNKARSGLTILGIVIGIASVIAMVAIGQGAQSSIESNIQSIGSNLLLIMPGAQRGPGSQVSSGRGSAQTLTQEDADAISSQIQGIQATAPETTKRYQVTSKGKNTNTSVVGTVPTYTTVRNLQIDKGTFIADSHVRQGAKVAVLGPTAATDLFGSGDSALGQTVRINQIQFKVVGVTKAKGGSGFSNQDDMVFVPLTTAQRFLTGNDFVSTISVQAVDPQSMTLVQEQMTQLLLKRHHITDPLAADFNIMNQSDIVAAASSVTGIFTLLLASIAGISLLVGGIGIMNMMLTTVTERTREIGLRKSIGAKNMDITLQFLSESVMLTFLGGFFGIILGYLLALIISKLGGINTTISTFSVLMAFGVSAAIGIVFGYYPARRAAGLNPIEALRYE